MESCGVLPTTNATEVGRKSSRPWRLVPQGLCRASPPQNEGLSRRAEKCTLSLDSPRTRLRRASLARGGASRHATLPLSGGGVNKVRDICMFFGDLDDFNACLAWPLSNPGVTHTGVLLQSRFGSDSSVRRRAKWLNSQSPFPPWRTRRCARLGGSGCADGWSRSRRVEGKHRLQQQAPPLLRQHRCHLRHLTLAFWPGVGGKVLLSGRV